MSRIWKQIAALCLVAMLSTGCTINRQDGGTALGAVAGGIAGHALGGSPAATIGGAVVGGFAGNQLSR